MSAPPASSDLAERRRGRPRAGHRRLGLLAALRGRIRASEILLTAIATGLGVLAGFATLGVAACAHGLQANSSASARSNGCRRSPTWRRRPC